MSARRLTAAEREALREAISERRLQLVQDEDARRAPPEPTPPTRLLSEFEQDCAALYGQGLSIRQIANRVRKPYNQVRNTLIGAGVKLRPRGGHADTTHDVLTAQLYLQRLSLVQVAASLGITVDRVRAGLQRAGVPYRPPGKRLTTADGLAA